MKQMATETLDGALLASVSRSFYLTIRLLPGSLRGPVGLAYLLARASDTIADSSSADGMTRQRWLAEFAAMIAGGAPEASLAGIIAGVQPEHRGEGELIHRMKDLLEALAQMSVDDRREVQGVLQKIVRGQLLDVERFHDAGSVHALPDAAALDEYTYLVAGCVGEFWTRMCFMHIRNYARRDQEAMLWRGAAFGQGLQLVNILRDLPADLAKGRCYLPADELKAVGVAPNEVQARAVGVRSVFDRWFAVASFHLDQGFRYIEASRAPRLRLACFLPWYLGVKTLSLMKRERPLETSRRLKVSRGEVRRALALGAGASVSNGALRTVRLGLVRELDRA